MYATALFVCYIILLLYLHCTASLIQARISLGRIQRFYELEEIDEEGRIWTNRNGINISNTNNNSDKQTTATSTTSGGTVVVSQGVFSWSPELTAEKAAIALANTKRIQAETDKDNAKANKKAAKHAKKSAVTDTTATTTGTADTTTTVSDNGHDATTATDAEQAADVEAAAAQQDVVKFESRLDFSVRAGELLAIVGSVGSGKSSVIAAMLGEMTRVEGTITVDGSVAYVAQTSYIMNMTLRDNILIGAPMDQHRYNAVLDACALTEDLAILPGGDLTEIGEKVNSLKKSHDYSLL
jgi:ABC-type multidrug transport system fused ATPase/permease subunit